MSVRTVTVMGSRLASSARAASTSFSDTWASVGLVTGACAVSCGALSCFPSPPRA